MPQLHGDFYTPNDFRTSSIPPYSTDPQLSIMRHADPDYVNSSDPSNDLYSSSTQMSDTLIPSSPPKSEPALGQMADDGDEPTDDDMADDDEEGGASTQSTLHFATGRESTLRYAENTKHEPVLASHCSSIPTSAFILTARSESSFGRKTPESIVSSVFDNDKKSDLMFDGLALERVPDAVRDLVDHIDLDNRLFKINFSNNFLLRLNQCVYQIKRLEFLDLRSNRLSELSPLIGQLVNLRELHLGHNRLKTLPAELLTMPRLKMLTTYPNEFIRCSKGSEENTSIELGSKLYIVSPTISLQELARRSFMKFLWKMSHDEVDYNMRVFLDEMHQLIAPISNAIEIGRVCSICSQPMVEPVAYRLKWTRHGEDRSGEIAPFQTSFCSGACLASSNL